MSLEDKRIMAMLKYVNESDYGFLNIEDGDFELTVVKKDMDLTELNNIISNQNNNQSNNIVTEDRPVMEEYQSQIVQQSSTKEQPVSTGEKSPSVSDENTFIVKAPMVGTFFRRPSPEEDEYVQVGESVSPEDTVCLIEVMKLFNSVPADVSGRVKEVLVADGELVEYDQPLFIIEMDEESNV